MELKPSTDHQALDKLNHANYHSFAPHAKAKLMEPFCTGEELPLPKPEPLATPKEGTGDTYQKQLREYCDDVQYYNEHLRQNDHAAGAINLLIEPNQFEYI